MPKGKSELLWPAAERDLLEVNFSQGKKKTFWGWCFCACWILPPRFVQTCISYVMSSLKRYPSSGSVFFSSDVTSSHLRTKATFFFNHSTGPHYGGTKLRDLRISLFWRLLFWSKQAPSAEKRCSKKNRSTPSMDFSCHVTVHSVFNCGKTALLIMLGFFWSNSDDFACHYPGWLPIQVSRRSCA